MYLRGERSDPAKRSSAKKTENCGICHLTQQEPQGAEGTRLGRSAEVFFFFFPLVVVAAPGADIGSDASPLAGLAATASLGRGPEPGCQADRARALRRDIKGSPRDQRHSPREVSASARAPSLRGTGCPGLLCLRAV